MNYKQIPRSFQIIALIQLIVFSLVTVNPSLVSTLALNRTMVVTFGQYYRLITAAFLHQDILHILMNLLAFISLVRVLSYVFNEKQLLLIYFVSLLGSSFAVISFTNTWVLGSSGAIFGLLAALTYVAIIENQRGNRQLLNSIFRILLLNLFISALPGISLVGHLGGFVVGLCITYFIVQRRFLS